MTPIVKVRRKNRRGVRTIIRYAPSTAGAVQPGWNAEVALRLPGTRVFYVLLGSWVNA